MVCEEVGRVIRVFAIVKFDFLANLVPPVDEWYFDYCLDCFNERLGGEFCVREPLDTAVVRY